MTEAFSIRALRKERSETLSEFATHVGVGSVSRMCEIENGQCGVPLPVALKIEALSVLDGVARIDAAELNEDVRAARSACPNKSALVHASSLSATGSSAPDGKGDEISMGVAGGAA